VVDTPTQLKMTSVLINSFRRILWFACICWAGIASAQQPISFKTGDEFMRETSTRSSSLLQLGNVKIDISSSSVVSKSYRVTGADNDGCTFAVTTKKIIDTVNSGDKKMVFSSDDQPDASSKIAVALNYIIGKPSNVNVDKNGIISAVDATNPVLANDTLLTFTGINAEDYHAGERFILLSGIVANGNLKEGFTWADSSSTASTHMNSNYTIYKITDAFITVQYATYITDPSINTNITGVYMIDRQTGIIAKRIMKSVSNGYQLYNNVLYAAARSTALSESCYRVK